MRILITGNLGYIGTILTPRLASEGYEVWGLDTAYYQECLFDSQSDSCEVLHKQIFKDIRDIKEEDLLDVDAIIHLAALSNDPTGEIDPKLTEEINYRASVCLAKSARNAGVSRFLFASSCSIYGQGGGKALTERAPFHPLTAYAHSKAKAEYDIAALACDSFSPVFLRCGTAYGFSPRLRFDIVVNNLTGWAFTTGQVKLMSDGRAWRPIVHIEDIASAFHAALAAPAEAIHNQALNVGQEEQNYQIRDIADLVAQIVPNCEVTYNEGASADSRTYHVSFEKIREVLPDFKPVWGLKRGIRQLYEAFKNNGLTLEEFQGRKYTRIKQLQYLLNSNILNSEFRWRRSNEV